MGILSIAANIRATGHEVAFVDLAGVPESCWFIPEGDFYGITATTPQYPTALKIIEKLPTGMERPYWVGTTPLLIRTVSCVRVVPLTW
jgi:hypothetical protein